MSDTVSSASTLERPALLRQVEIPPTDPEHYITGLYALNVQAPEGTSGDWHDVFHWQKDYDNPPRVTLGGSAEVDTTPIYGGWGVYEGKDCLLAMGLAVPSEVREVYLANHTRAAVPVADSLGARPQPDRRRHRLAGHLRAGSLPAGAGRVPGSPLPGSSAG